MHWACAFMATPSERLLRAGTVLKAPCALPCVFLQPTCVEGIIRNPLCQVEILRLRAAGTR